MTLFSLLSALLACSSTTIFLASCSDLSNPLVVTLDGSVEGRKTKTDDGYPVQEYLGIPFAKPPVGSLRYADPEPVEPWTSVLKAKKFGPSCHQLLDLTFGNFSGSSMWNAPNEMDEDCLYLNVWTPDPRPTNAAVMVWIFGGGFYSGTAALDVYDGKTLAAYTGVIVASMNYRVGSLGFLATGDDRIKGNFGLKDQLMALKWIKNNIGNFGGDDKLITIMGESAGAASVGYHLMAHQSRDLFKRAIMQSGAPDAHWAFMSQQQARDRSAKFFKALNCQNDENILQCLRNCSLSPTTIVNTEWVDTSFLTFPWAPSKDGSFLRDTPSNLIKQNRLKKTELLAGTNNDEGTFWILYAVPTYSKDSRSLQTWNDLVKAVNITDYDLTIEQKKQLLDFYTKGKSHSDQKFNRDVLDNIVGDRSFVCPTMDFADAYDSKRTYIYHLKQRASNEVWPSWMGVIHGADVQYVFGIPVGKEGYSVDDMLLSMEIMFYWSNFAKYGNPNNNREKSEFIYWPSYTQTTKKYINFMPNVISKINKKVRPKYCQFWKNLIK